MFLPKKMQGPGALHSPIPGSPKRCHVTQNPREEGTRMSLETAGAPSLGFLSKIRLWGVGGGEVVTLFWASVQLGLPRHPPNQELPLAGATVPRHDRSPGEGL